MEKRRFFDRPSGVTVARIVSLTGAEAADAARMAHLITDVAALDHAGPTDLVFIESSKYAEALTMTRAGVCLMPRRFENWAPDSLVVLRTEEPYRAFVAVHRELYPQALRPTSLFEAEGIAPGSTIHPSARLESGVIVDPGAVIGPRAEIGAGTLIAATVAIGPDVVIGRECAVGAGSTIMHALIGDRVVIHPGCRIGQDGFGYVDDATQLKIPQTGRVIIENDVEIGAGTAIDRGGIRDTIIGEGQQDRQPVPDRPQRRDRPPLRHCRAIGTERQRDARGLRRFGWCGRPCAACHHRPGRAGGGALGRHERHSAATDLGRLPRAATHAMDAPAGHAGPPDQLRRKGGTFRRELKPATTSTAPCKRQGRRL